MTNKEILKLPQRKWDEVKEYDSITLVDTGRKHESGFSLIAVVGYSKEQDCSQGEIAAMCDDVSFNIPAVTPNSSRAFACDMEYRSGRTHFHSWYYRFKVGMSISTTDITLVPIGRKKVSL